MEFLPWSDKYLTGIAAIDADHKELFRLVNDLHGRVRGGWDEDTIAATLRDLVDYVDRHFRREEELMQEIDYPDRVAHAKQHRKLAETVHGLKTLFDDEPSQLDSDAIMNFLRDWLKGHILGTDMDYVAHMEASREIHRSAH